MANLERKMALEEISQQAKLSPFYFCRLFKQTVGMTPYQYVRKQRIERAKQLLKKRSPVAEIALMCGFCDRSTFTTSFRQAVGVTPKQYRLNS